MPKPRSPDDAVVKTYGNKYGYLTKYTRLYIRENGKFIPMGWRLQFYQSYYDRKLNKYVTNREILHVTDKEIGYIP
jgi:hypothetical protein